MTDTNRRPGSRRSPTTKDENPGGNRKRTLVVSLLALGAGAAGVGGYIASGDDKEVAGSRIFVSQEQCQNDKSIPREECGKQFASAIRAHEKAAPLYPSKDACEQEFGDNKCTHPTSSGTRNSYYIPAMTGYMMARSTGGGYQSAPLYRRRNDPPGQYRQMAAFPQPVPGTQPASRTNSRAFRTRTWTTRPGSTRVSSPSRSSSRSSFGRTSRGGFGSSSRGYSGG